MKPTIADWILESIEKRKKAKTDIDNAIALSNDESSQIAYFNAYFTPYEDGKKRVRMLDEGAVVRDDGSVRIFLKKGTIQKYYDALPDDYVGYVNLGHFDLESLPLLLGTWTKNDLHLIEKEDGRMALDADIHLDEELMIVQDLKKQKLPLSVSVEMMHEIDEDMSEKLQMPIADEIFILGVSVVGNPANVNSADVQLGNEGENEMGIKDLLNSISQTKEELETEVEETTEELANEEETQVENLESQEVEETSEVENLDDAADETVSEDDVNRLSEYIEKLTTKVEELKKENGELRSQLAKEKKEKETLSANIENSIGRIENLMGEHKEVKKEKLSSEPEVDGWYYRG